MKKYLLILTALAGMSMMTSCDKESEGKTWITAYPVIELDGPTNMTWEAGVPFADPGLSVTLDGVDITDQIEILTDMDLDDPQPGFYAVNYVATNSDGFSATASRNVIVIADGDEVSGFYTTSPESYRVTGGPIFYGKAFPEYIYQIAPGEYFVSDLLGGWYQYRMNYGANYAMTGSISINEDGDVELLDSYIAGWGDGLDWLEEGLFDTATGTLSYQVSYAQALEFVVQMTKN